MRLFKCQSVVMDDYKYSEAFKTEVVRQIVELGHPIQRVAERLKVPYEQLSRWLEVAALKPKIEQTDVADAVHQENLRLKRELQEITKERDLLKQLLD